MSHWFPCHVPCRRASLSGCSLLTAQCSDSALRGAGRLLMAAHCSVLRLGAPGHWVTLGGCSVLTAQCSDSALRGTGRLLVGAHCSVLRLGAPGRWAAIGGCTLLSAQTRRSGALGGSREAPGAEMSLARYDGRMDAHNTYIYPRSATETIGHATSSASRPPPSHTNQIKRCTR